jgi:hypothetical protein
MCVDVFNAAKRFSTFAFNTAQRSSTQRINGFQPNSTLKKFRSRLSGLIACLCYSIRRLSANRISAKRHKLHVDEFRHHP